MPNPFENPAFREMFVNLGASAMEASIENPYARKAARFIQHAAKWSVVAKTGLRCQIYHRTPAGTHACGAAAIAICVACKTPTCLDHAMVSPADGSAFCFACVGAAQKRQQQGERDETAAEDRCICRSPSAIDPSCPLHGFVTPQSVDERDILRKHLTTLGLDESATWEEIRRKFKRRAAKEHPDRFPATAKRRQEKRFAELNEAFQWLKSYHERAA